MGNYKGVIIVLCILSLASLALIVYEQHVFGNTAHQKSMAFQKFACGLGLGASVDAKWGFINFDPRVDPVDETTIFPVPGGYSYSPDRAMTVTGIDEIAVK